MRSGNDKGRVPKRNSLPVTREEASNVAEILDGMFFTKDEHNAGFSRAWKPVIDGKIQLERPSISNVSGSSDVKKDDDGNDSDSEIRRVPELLEKSKPVHSSRRKRTSTSSNDKEGKRLKRLLRNRVSAQQARERKKAYLIELERKAKDLEARNAELEEKNATLQRENYMLRQIVKNTTMRGGDMES